jgi:hypothetical protein
VIKRLVLLGIGAAGALGMAAGPALALTSPQVPAITSPTVTNAVSGPLATASGALQHAAANQPATGTGAASSGGSALAARGSDYNPSTGGYTPPVHGTNPYGEGTPLAVTTEPRPAPDGANCDAPSSDEVAVIGRSCGQQGSGGSYSGHVTGAAIGGHELIGESSGPSGSTTTGALAPVAGPALPAVNGALQKICTSSNQSLCLVVLGMSSTSTASGSTNSFQGASAQVGGGSGLSASVLTSSGSISQSGGCQTATGRSRAAGVSAAGQPVADVAQSQDSSTACGDPAQDSQSHRSQVVGGALGSALSPAAGAVPGWAGCAQGAPNTSLGLNLPPQAGAVICNATDSDGSQAAAPYGTAEALAVIVLNSVGVHVATSESAAHAPAPTATAPNPTPSSGSRGQQGSQQPPSATAPVAHLVASPATAAVATPAAAAVAAPAHGLLAFTGLDLMLEIMGAVALACAGFATWLISRTQRA